MLVDGDGVGVAHSRGQHLVAGEAAGQRGTLERRVVAGEDEHEAALVVRVLDELHVAVERVVRVGHHGKRRAGVGRRSHAPCLVDGGVQVQRGHEGMDCVQRGDGVGVGHRRADDDGVILSGEVHRQRTAGLDGRHRVVDAAAHLAVGTVGAQVAAIEEGHLCQLRVVAHLHVVDVAAAGGLHVDVHHAAVVRAALGQRPVLPRAALAGVGGEGLADNLQLAVGIHGVETDASALAVAVRLDAEGHFLAHHHIGDIEGIGPAVDAQPQVLATVVGADAGRSIVDGNGCRALRAVLLSEEEAFQLGNHLSVGLQRAVFFWVLVPEATLVDRSHVVQILHVAPACLVAQFVVGFQVVDGLLAPLGEVPSAIALCVAYGEDQQRQHCQGKCSFHNCNCFCY